MERLQVKASSIGRILTNLERKYNNAHDKDDPNIKRSPSGQSISSQKRAPNKIQQIPPFNASRIRKSPSTEPATVVAQEEEKEELKEVEKEDKEVKELNEKVETIEE